MTLKATVGERLEAKGGHPLSAQSSIPPDPTPSPPPAPSHSDESPAPKRKSPRSPKPCPQIHPQGNTETTKDKAPHSSTHPSKSPSLQTEEVSPDGHSLWGDVGIVLLEGVKFFLMGMCRGMSTHLVNTVSSSPSQL